MISRLAFRAARFARRRVSAPARRAADVAQSRRARQSGSPLGSRPEIDWIGKDALFPTVLRHGLTKWADGQFNVLGTGWRSYHKTGGGLDWNFDPVSGHRWPSDAWYQDIRIEFGKGYDIKIPWEIGRLSHLPLLGRIAASDDGLQAQAAALFVEHLTDFIRANPVRMGVQWTSTMDVSIRVCNMIVAREIFRAADVAFPPEFDAIFGGSVRDHAEHIASNLEWVPHFRGNHYLVDVAGLAISASYLSGEPRYDSWRIAASFELEREFARQSFGDGGHVEGAVAYHGLVFEAAMLATAVIRATPPALTPANPTHLPLPLVRHAFRTMTDSPSAAHLLRLARARDFHAAMLREDGSVVPVGDDDSGAILRLWYPWAEGDDGPLECVSHAAWRQGLDRLCPLPDVPAAAWRGGDFGSLPPVADDTQTYTFRADLANAEVHAFPESGFFVIRKGQTHLTIRCGGVHPHSTGGHHHVDQLAVVLRVDGDDVIPDPGTFTYTRDVVRRDAYRHETAHFVPRLEGETLVELGGGPFRLEIPAARCLAFAGGPAGSFVGRWTVRGRTIERAVQWSDEDVVIMDRLVAGSGRLARLPLRDGRFDPGLPISPAYGVTTSHAS